MPEGSRGRGLPLHVVVMGVSGTGKSAVGRELAAQLEVELIEGDQYHPRKSIEKMSAGIALTDEDRMPWLRALAVLLASNHADGRSSVLTCSALRRSYREVLRGDLPDAAMFFVHLHAVQEVLEARVAGREGHFMPVSLLRSQLDTLEPLGKDEQGVLLDVSLPLPQVVAAARRSLPVRRP